MQQQYQQSNIICIPNYAKSISCKITSNYFKSHRAFVISKILKTQITVLISCLLLFSVHSSKSIFLRFLVFSNSLSQSPKHVNGINMIIHHVFIYNHYCKISNLMMAIINEKPSKISEFFTRCRKAYYRLFIIRAPLRKSKACSIQKENAKSVL